jgi:hypothetical protein
MHAQILNTLKDQHYPVSMVLDNCKAAAKRCNCHKLSCPACGMVMFVARVTRVDRRNPAYPDSTGYLSGGKP